MCEKLLACIFELTVGLSMHLKRSYDVKHFAMLVTWKLKSYYGNQADILCTGILCVELYKQLLKTSIIEPALQIAGNVLQTELKQRTAGFLQKLHDHKEQMAKQSSFCSDRIAIDADQNSQACGAGIYRNCRSAKNSASLLVHSNHTTKQGL